LHGRIPDLTILPTFQEEPFGSDALPFLDTGKPLSMTSEVMDSNFPFSDTADIANDR
jgi:hypothetical protein